MRPLAWCVAVVLVSCAPPGTVPPSSAKVDDLVGWWLNLDPGGGKRVYGFVAPPDGPWSVPVPFSLRDQPISTIYFGGAPHLRASFEVKEGSIVETVIDSLDFDPGKQFSTKIVSLVRKQSLSLSAPSAPGGVRAYTWNEYCPLTLESGWSAVPTLNYPSYFATASTLAFDSKGRLHSFTGMAGEQDGRFPARPTYAVLDKGCEAAWFTASNARAAAMVVDASDVVHLFWTESAIYSEGPDGTLMHKYRPTESEQWTTEPVPTSQAPVTFKVATRGPRLVLVTQGRAPSGVELHELRDGAWTTTVATIDGGLTGALGGASIDPAGRLWLSFAGRLLRERAPGDFEVLAAPPAPLALVGDFYVDGAGRAHHFVSRGPDGMQHGIYEDEAWRFLPAPLGEGFVPVEAPPWKYFSVTTHAFPFLVLVTQTDSGVNTYEFVNGRFTNPTTSTVRGVAVARDGTIAVSETGEAVSVKRPVAPWGEVRTTPVTITIGGTGAGRVWSDDGRIDCTATCTVDLPVLSRHRVHTDPAPQNTLSKSSGERDDFSTRFAWLNIADDPARFSENRTNAFTFEFARSTTPEVIALSPPTGSLGALTRWDAEGSRLVLSSATSSGKVWLRDAEYAAPDAGAGEVLLLARGDAAPVLRRLPAAPSSLGLLAGGGAHGLFFVNRALSFDGTPLNGTTAAPLVARVAWDNSLTQFDLQALLTLPANSVVQGTVVDPSGSAAAVISNGFGFPAYGANVFAVLVWRKASGEVTVTPFEAGTTLSMPRLAVRGSKLVVNRALELLFFDDGARVATRTLVGANLGPFVASSSGVQAVATVTSGSVDFGGGTLDPTIGAQYAVTWGFDGAFVSATQVQPPFTRAFAAAAESRGLLVLDETMGGPWLFLAGQNRGEPLVRAGTAVRVMSAKADVEGMWALVQQQAATVDYGVASLTGAGRLVLVKAVLP